MTMIIKKSINSINPYITLDESLIYEIFNPINSPVKGLSIAFAIVEPGQQTKLHLHKDFDEIYFIIEGNGLFISDKHSFKIAQGDAILILRNTIHSVKAGDSKLKILCICIPPYKHESTKVIV